MIFVREGCKPVLNPSAERLERELSRTKSSFASLTSADGAYVQVAGGPGLFLLERRDEQGHFRAFQVEPVVSHPDGTLLLCSVGSIPMRQGDWLLRWQVLEVFGALSGGSPWPPYVCWRESQIEAHAECGVKRRYV